MPTSPQSPTIAGSSRTEKILVTIKAYPNPSSQYIETVCVAGITESGNFIRLYPIPFRDLEYDQQFKVFNWIEATVAKTSKDYRKESHYIVPASIKVGAHVGTENQWAVRRSIIDPLVSPSIEALQDQFTQDHTSLGIIRPKRIKRLIIKKETPQWTPTELAKLRQRTLFDAIDEQGTEEAIRDLEKIPYRFQYEFECDDPRCKGHTFSVISWEVMQSYRKWREDYGDAEWEAKFRQMYEQKLLDDHHDLHFFVGTIFQHPHVWGINGLFYPPKTTVTQPSLF